MRQTKNNPSMIRFKRSGLMLQGTQARFCGLLPCDTFVARLPVGIVSVLKGFGYLVSTLSVVLLGIVSWKSASEQPFLFLCLILGMLASVAGMSLRWISHRIEQKEKARDERAARAASLSGRFPPAGCGGGPLVPRL
jgi:hypothetical protein